MDSRDVVHSSHLGAFLATVRDGRVEQTRPFPGDADPSPIVSGIADGIGSTARIQQPAVRRGWLEHGPGATSDRRGADWAAAITGVPAGQIAMLAEDMARSRTLVSSTWSLQRADHGEQPFWMLVTLAAMLGQIGLPGGGFGFAYGSESGIGTVRYPFPPPALPVGHNPVTTAIPVARLSDMLLHPGDGYQFNGERAATRTSG
jgi:hypothetical protein